MRGLGDKSSEERVARVQSAEGVHRAEIGHKADRGVIVLCPRDKFQYARQSRARLTDDDINRLGHFRNSFRKIHKTRIYLPNL